MLTKSQIRFLRAKAHHLHVVVSLGQAGVSEAVIKEFERALESHELIKVKLGNLDDSTQKEMIDTLIQHSPCELVQKIGHLAIFFRAKAQDSAYPLPKK